MTNIFLEVILPCSQNNLERQTYKEKEGYRTLLYSGYMAIIHNLYFFSHIVYTNVVINSVFLSEVALLQGKSQCTQDLLCPGFIFESIFVPGAGLHGLLLGGYKRVQRLCQKVCWKKEQISQSSKTGEAAGGGENDYIILH